MSESVSDQSGSSSSSASGGTAPGPDWRRWGIAVLVGLGLAGAVVWAGDLPKTNGHYGAWSMLPPLVAIVLAFWLREVVSALFLGSSRADSWWAR